MSADLSLGPGTLCCLCHEPFEPQTTDNGATVWAGMVHEKGLAHYNCYREEQP